MQVQSIKIAQHNNKIYSSNPNGKFDCKSNQYGQVVDEFASANKAKAEVNFGASIEELANEFLHSSNFDSALRAEIKREQSSGEKALNWLFGEYENTISSKFNEVKARIRELKEEIEEEQREARRASARLSAQRAEVSASKRREQEILEQISKENIKNEKMRKLDVKRAELEVEKHKLGIEEEKLNADKNLLKEQKFGNFAEVLKDKFINLTKMEKSEKTGSSTSSNSSISFPNGIMLSGLEKNRVDELVNWTVEKSDCVLKKIDFNNFDSNGALAELWNITKNTQDKRTLIHIDNFKKFTAPTEENEVFIAKFKAVLSSCAEKYKCTIITEIEDPSELAPEITAAQRFQVKIKSEE